MEVYEIKNYNSLFLLYQNQVNAINGGNLGIHTIITKSNVITIIG